MSLEDFIFGTPPSGEPGFIPDPMYGFANVLGEYLTQLLNSGNMSAPENPYNINIPLSPTNENWGRMTQAYSQSPAPYIMGQAAGTMGQFMNPEMDLNPATRLGGLFDGKSMTDLFNQPSQGSFDLSKIPGRATGGPVQQGKPYVVGEQGPEVMVPQTGGYVQPNPGSMQTKGNPGAGPPSQQYPTPPNWGPPPPVNTGNFTPMTDTGSFGFPPGTDPPWPGPVNQDPSPFMGPPGGNWQPAMTAQSGNPQHWTDFARNPPLPVPPVPGDDLAK